MKFLKLSLILISIVFLLINTEIINPQTSESSIMSEDCQAESVIILNVQFSPDGNYLIANWPPHSVRMWNTITGEIEASLTDDGIDERELFALSPNNKYLATAGNSGLVILWDAQSSKTVRTFSSPKNVIALPSGKTIRGAILAISFSPDGKYIAILDETDASLWDVETGIQVFEFQTTHHGKPTVRFSPSGDNIIIEDRIWDTQTGQLLHEFDSVNDALYSPDGKYIIGHQLDNTVLMDAKTYRTVHILDKATSTWQFSPNGNYLLSLKEEGTVFVWDVEKGKLLHQFNAFTPIGYSIVVSFLDNKSVFLVKRSGGMLGDRTIFATYNIETGDELHEVTIDLRLIDIQSFALTLNQQYLAVGGIPTSPVPVTVWDIASGKQIYQYC